MDGTADEKQVALAITEQIRTFSSKFEQYASREVAEVERIQQAHERTMQDLTEQQIQVQRDHSGLQESTQIRTQKTEAARLGVLALERSQASATERAASLPAKAQELSERKVSMEAVLTEKMAELGLQTKKKETTIAYLTKAVSCYQNRLGLEFKQESDGRLHVTFRNIDAKQPDRIFSFTLKLDKDNAYNVLSCEPPIADLGNLVTELKSSNDLSRFVQVVRKRFVVLAASPVPVDSSAN